MAGMTREEIEARGHPVWAEVDLAAIRHNVSLIDTRVGEAEVMGVVKGYAYGHGNPNAARAMLQGGATRLGVARIAEALHLRDSGVTAPIHVFTEAPLGAAPTMIAADLTPTVYTEAFAGALSAAAQEAGKITGVHVKLDTGMHRVGLPADAVADAIKVLRDLPNLEIEGAWSHLAVADVPGHPFTARQLALFLELVETIERAGVQLRFKHVANSAAALSLPESAFDLVRCGIASYGLQPGVDLPGSEELRPALSLRARTSMVKRVPAGDALSYGLRYELSETSNVVTVGAGYADGYDRRLSGRADVLIAGRRHRVSGTVCMDQFMVDVGDNDVDVGATVTLIGEDSGERISAEELAEAIGTINYEVTTRIPSRVPRVYLNEEAD